MRNIPNRTCAILAAVEAIPPKPKTAATREITKNTTAQYNMGHLLLNGKSAYIQFKDAVGFHSLRL
jgi:hypothetical protein